MRDGMTVAELMERLEQMDPEKKVMFGYNYGDYWRYALSCHVILYIFAA